MIELLKTFLSLLQMSQLSIPTPSKMSLLPEKSSKPSITASWEQEVVENQFLADLQVYERPSPFPDKYEIFLKRPLQIGAELKNAYPPLPPAEKKKMAAAVRRFDRSFLALEPLKECGATDAQLLRAAKNGDFFGFLRILKKRQELGMEAVPKGIAKLLEKDGKCERYAKQLMPEAWKRIQDADNA